MFKIQSTRTMSVRSSTIHDLWTREWGSHGACAWRGAFEETLSYGKVRGGFGARVRHLAYMHQGRRLSQLRYIRSANSEVQHRATVPHTAKAGRSNALRRVSIAQVYGRPSAQAVVGIGRTIRQTPSRASAHSGRITICTLRDAQRRDRYILFLSLARRYSRFSVSKSISW